VRDRPGRTGPREGSRRVPLDSAPRVRRRRLAARGAWSARSLHYPAHHGSLWARLPSRQGPARGLGAQWDSRLPPETSEVGGRLPLVAQWVPLRAGGLRSSGSPRDVIGFSSCVSAAGNRTTRRCDPPSGRLEARAAANDGSGAGICGGESPWQRSGGSEALVRRRPGRGEGPDMRRAAPPVSVPGGTGFDPLRSPTAICPVF